MAPYIVQMVGVCLEFMSLILMLIISDSFIVLQNITPRKVSNLGGITVSIENLIIDIMDEFDYFVTDLESSWYQTQ